MELSLFYFVFILFILLSRADPTEVDNQCPTSRRLLLFGGSDLLKGEKKSPQISSSSKVSAPPSSPPKYARTSESNGLVSYIRPDSSTPRVHKGRSYTHLLKPKLHGEKEKKKHKRSSAEHKKSVKKKDPTQYKSSAATKSHELVAIDEEELNRCRALLQLDTVTDTIDEKKSKKVKSSKSTVYSKTDSDNDEETRNIKKKSAAGDSSLPINEKKTKATKETSFAEKKPAKVVNIKTNDNRPFTAAVDAAPTKVSSPPPPPATNTKSKRDQKSESPPVVERPTKAFDIDDEQAENDTESVVNRALHFVKNMFQLSDDSLNDEHRDENHVIDITQDQQQHHHHHSRKLLTIIDDDEMDSNQTETSRFDLNWNDEQSIETADNNDNWAYAGASISKRQLLSVKTNRQATPSKSTTAKDKKAKSKSTPDAVKPKVGWAYRYRISRYLNAQKMKRTGKKSKGANKSEDKSKQHSKKSNAKNNAKVPKRKLLGYSTSEDSSELDKRISNPDIVDSVLITENFIPKRQLLASKSKNKEKSAQVESGNDHQRQTNTRRQMKAFEELTDPVAIVNSYDRGLFKPRVGWQFRYRVSRYIDALRENIREDQERLKLGLQAIKRKTPQELSGRRKRVLDKPFAPDPEEVKKQKEAAAQENKPHVGWRYRYRISRMNEAKRRGEFVNDEEEKRKARREEKHKQANISKPVENEKELDSELRQVSAEGRRVGWAYRYRIRRKLDDLKHQQALTGKSFDITTLGGKREKKTADSKVKPVEKKATQSVEQKPTEKKKSVGWEYRYRLSKMREAQKHDKSKASKGKQADKTPVHEQVDPKLAHLTPEQRAVGWKYRYRIRRKLDSAKDASSVNSQREKRPKKVSSKGKKKEKIIKKVEESIEKILNIDDIDETPFMEYFRRGSSYILFGLIPPAKKSICLLPLPVTFSFCNRDNNDQIVPTTTTTTTKAATTTKSKKAKKPSKKKLKTKKEQKAKQFIHARVTKLGADDKATERRVDETMKVLYKKPSLPPLQVPPTPPTPSREEEEEEEEEEKSLKQHVTLPKRSADEVPKKRPNKNANLTKSKIGVDSKKNKNKKQFQIIGKEVKTKNKRTSVPPPTPAVTTDAPSTVETKTTTASPPLPRLRTISEIIQEDAANILGTNRKGSRTPEEVQAEAEEANEIVRERTKPTETTTTIITTTTTTTTTQPTLVESTTSEEEESNDKISANNEEKTTGESVQQSVDDMLNLDQNKDSS